MRRSRRSHSRRGGANWGDKGGRTGLNPQRRSRTRRASVSSPSSPILQGAVPLTKKPQGTICVIGGGVIALALIVLAPLGCSPAAACPQAQVAEAEPVPPQAAPPRAELKFDWPVRGRIVYGCGIE